SANGRFAARLAGMLAGLRGTPTTVLRLGRPAGKGGDPQTAADAARAGAEAGVPPPSETGSRPAAVAAITRTHQKATKEAVTAQAQRGYDLLVIGLDQPVMGSGAFRPPVAQSASGFDGAIAVMVARGRHLERPLDARFSILLPSTGTAVSRQAAEVA